MIVRGPLSAFSEVVSEKRRWTPEWYSWLVDLSTPFVTTFEGLQAPGVVGPGARAFVTDATITTFLGAVTTGGGANKVPVVSDGTNWVVG